MQEKLIARDLLDTLMSNMDRKEAVAIRGPRQSGKTTLLEMLRARLLDKGTDEDDITQLSFEDPAVLDEFAKDPRAYLSTFVKGSRKHYFLLDEVQYDKQAGKRLKLLYDSVPDIKLIVTGSSTLDISKIATFLVGRVFLYELLPLSFAEYLRHENQRLYAIFSANHREIAGLLLKGKKPRFDKVSVAEVESHAEQYIRFGGYPAVVMSEGAPKKIEVLKNIYITYLEKDIPGIFGITDTQSMRKTILNLALNMGNLLDYNSISADTGLYYSKLMRYLSILQDTYIIRLVAPFYKNRLTELRKNKKLYFLDTGIRNYIVQNFNALDKREDSGRLFENFVSTELHLIAAPTQSINYWRTTAKAEVDFVFGSPNFLTPIEVKRTVLKKPVVERSMQSFMKAYRPKNAVVFGRGTINGTRLGPTNIHFPSISFL